MVAISCVSSRFKTMRLFTLKFYQVTLFLKRIPVLKIEMCRNDDISCSNLSTINHNAFRKMRNESIISNIFYSNVIIIIQYRVFIYSL